MSKKANQLDVNLQFGLTTALIIYGDKLIDLNKDARHLLISASGTMPARGSTEINSCKSYYVKRTDIGRATVSKTFDSLRERGYLRRNINGAGVESWFINRERICSIINGELNPGTREKQQPRGKAKEHAEKTKQKKKFIELTSFEEKE